jgi:hypothetical protein
MIPGKGGIMLQGFRAFYLARPVFLALPTLVLVLLVLVSCSKFETPLNPMPYVDEGPPLTADQLAIPADLQVAEVGDTFLQLVWADTTGTPPAIVIQGKRTGESDYSLWHILPAGIQQWDAPVQPDSSYVFRIAARNAEGHSPFTAEVAATAWPRHYWEVTGGIHHQHPGYRSVFFRFGRANRFRPSGTLVIRGPEGWNDDREFRQHWGSYYIGLNARGAVSGIYELEFTSGDRRHETSVYLNENLVLPLPVVQYELLPERQLAVSWDCPDADSSALIFGPLTGAPVVSVSVRDTVLVFPEAGQEFILGVEAYKEDLQGQPASSGWSTRLEYPISEGL